MNYLDESSEIDSRNDLEREDDLNDRLLDNYKRIKDSIRRQNLQTYSHKASVRSVEKAIEIEQQKNLETRIALTEKQYSKARQNNILLLKKLGEAEEYNQFLKFQLQKIKRERNEEAALASQTILNLRKELQLVRDDQLSHLREAELRGVSNLQHTLQLREKEISKLSLKIKSLEVSLQQSQTNNKQALRQIEDLNQQIQGLQSQSDRSYENNPPGSQLLELQQLRKAVQRLLQLLKGTQDFKKFSIYAQNCKQLCYLDKLSASVAASCCKRPRAGSRGKATEEEKLLWSPTNCYKTLQAIKERYDSLNENCIQEILFELNRLYLEREDNNLKKVRQEYEGIILKFKQKHLLKYDQIVARKQIERLKKQLQQTRFSKVSQSQELHLLKTVGDYEDELRLRDKEIRLLSERLRLLEHENMGYDKVLYLEGALWLIDKVLDEVSLYREELSLTESRLFQKNQGAGQEEVHLLRELSQSFGQSAASLHEKLLSMKEATLRKMNLQKRDVDADCSLPIN